MQRFEDDYAGYLAGCIRIRMGFRSNNERRPPRSSRRPRGLDALLVFTLERLKRCPVCVDF
jgi:hypothetical protein